MPQGIVIPVDEAEPIYKRTFDHFTDYQAVLGGLIEPIDLDAPPASLYVNEEGKTLGLDLNRRASLILWLHAPVFRYSDVVAGPAIIVGPVDDEGETQSIPPMIENLLLGTDQYKVEVTTHGDPETWNGNQRRYDNWVDAYNGGLSLASRWLAVERVRVMAA